MAGGWDGGAQLPPGQLALGLLRASEALNRRLLERLVADGWPPLTRNQALVFANLDPGGTTPAELARRLDITRQSVHQLLAPLLEGGLLRQDPHPADARSVLVRVGPRGGPLLADARRHLAELEGELERRLGSPALRALRRALADDWGPWLSG